MSNEELMLEELRAIRKALEPPPEPEVEEVEYKGVRGFFTEFKDFLSKYKVMGLAVAFILGLYLGTLVSALVDDIVMPIVQLGLPEEVKWEEITWGVFRVGHFAGALLTFIIVALVVFILVKITTRLGIE